MGIKYFLKAGNLKTAVAPFKKIFTALRERISANFHKVCYIPSERFQKIPRGSFSNFLRP